MSKTQAEREQEQTLGYLRTKPDGSVTAVHRWYTGQQVLVFANMERFKQHKAAIESPTKATKASGK